ncbi:A disintegrin and metalloproteinase with thrombospondin motifs 12 isoform X1 [Rousettus aegyptiacus]|uniref:ADAM metallopeptidase with thrombospondin type 1 motif 12 n=2 Tax=Rousettus aegyptiacus TaxID=9407 RepID=A0A7J8EVY0_ROUAE|nr:A disintegrin and metalloproteinase with thrombospondin motifs 12 isoform X1 [Rousettus aegyptiacus]KAF6439654.1 ADAM metallopeptidase with thrombospondin type 1 motif 12 [Rousettus aegyptiacus]
MPCVQRSWLTNLLVVAQLLNFGGQCYGGPPQPGQLRFPDRRQEYVIKGLPEYHVVAPVRVDASGHFLSYGLHHPFTGSRRKRDLGGPEDRVYYRISHEEKDLFFNLTVNQGFLSRSYIVERRYGNLSHIKMAASSAPPCHLKGTVLEQGTGIGTAALSSCHGLTGFFRLPHGDFFIEPVKKHPLAEGEYHPHIIYRKQRRRGLDLKEPTCGLKDSLGTSQKLELQREKWERNNLPSRSLSRRSISKERWVETLVVADTKMVEYHGSENVESYILTIMNMVTGLFHSPSIGNAIHIVVVRLILLEEEEQGLKIVHHAEKTLSSFCKWQKSINPKSDLNPAHHDVAVLLTRKDICAGVNRPCETLGLSHLSGMCQPHRSCNINEDSGLPLAFTIAHELGHSFGIQHDGKENDCEPVGRHPYIMSRQLQYNPTPLTWSKCSKEYVTRFLDRGWGFCLDDVPQKKGLKSKVIAPGVIYDVHHQCQLQYGPNATFCQEVENVCQTLWCSVKGFCRSKLDAAADGTRCGEKKWCMAGKCITVGKKPESIPGGWGRWSPWSHCSRTCGAGAQSAERLCNNPEPKFGGKYCTGERKRYRLCNVHACPLGTPTFRQMQCSEFDTVPYKNEFYHWFPVFNPAHPCELYCRPIDGQFSEKMLDAVIDGTPCFEGGNSRNVCINGMCKMVGCDYEIDSSAAEDRCGVCLGDGSACQTVRKMFKQKEGSGYVDIGLIPKGARDIRVMEVKGAGNFLAIRSEDPEKYYLNGGFIIQWNGNYKLAGTVFQYDRKGDLEKLMATGPTNESVWIQLLFQVTNPGIKYEYTIRKDGLDNDVEKLVYFWQYGRWTECSVTCGTGIRRQTAHCVKKGHGVVKVTFCDPETQPNGRQKKCHEKDCPPRWWAGEWEVCSATCGPHGEKKRTVLCIQTVGTDEQALPAKDCQHLLKPKALISCNRDILCPSDWTVGNWSECSVSCGGGVRIRSVTCAKNNDEPCDMTRKPNSRALCGLRQCLSSRRVLKPNKGTVFNGKKLPTSEQDPLEPNPPTTSNPRMLTTATVPESMSTSSPAVTSPGPTSASKEGDLGRKRWQNGSTQTEPDSHDVISPGSTSQPILTSWSLSVQSNEENISKSDPGPTSDGDLSTTTTSSSDLSPSSNPVTWQVTPFYNTLTEEPEKEIHSGSGENSEQPEYKNENSSIVWTKIGVPGNDAPEERSTEMPLGPPPTPYLWGASLWSPFSTVTKGLLPSQGPPALKNDMPRAEGMVTEKPAHTPLPLREDRQPAPSEKLVNRSLPELPNTSPTQSSEPVLTEEDATSLIAEGFLLNASNYKQLSTGRSTAHWVVGNWSECSTTCGLGAYWRRVECSTQVDSDCAATQRPDPAKRCHLRPCAGWKVGNWSKCSRNCSGGFQTREIQCVDSREDRSLRPFHCQFLAGVPPPLSTSCNVEPCEEWRVEPWSQCSRSCGGGVQERGVTCPRGLCDWAKRPTSTAPCNRHPCCHWATGNWDLCTASCGGGFQKRTVYCVSSEDNKTEDQDQCLCDHEPRPLEFQKCNQQACRKSADMLCTKDNLSASFCQTLKTMKKCSVPTVRAQCCMSCSQTHVVHTRRPLRKPQSLKNPTAF